MTEYSASGSLLFVPGHRPDRFDKAIGSGASQVIIDLEDGVPAERKPFARRAIAEWSRAVTEMEAIAWIRISGEEPPLIDELEIVVKGPFAGTMIPKAEDPEFVAEVHLLTRKPVIAMVESARGVVNAHQLSTTSGVVAIALGEQDLIADLGIEADARSDELAHHRAALVLASAASGIEPPIGPVWTSIKDLDGLRESSDALRRIGFGSRGVIHPTHIHPTNAVFAPTADKVEWANRVLARSSGGESAFVDDDEFIDEAVLKRARRIVGRA